MNKTYILTFCISLLTFFVVAVIALLLLIPQQGKVLNEELKHNVAEKLRKPVSVETVEKDLQNMDVEDLEALKAKIEELQKAKNETNE